MINSPGLTNTHSIIPIATSMPSMAGISNTKPMAEAKMMIKNPSAWVVNHNDFANPQKFREWRVSIFEQQTMIHTS